MKMDDLISREEALKVCDKYNGQGYVWSCIRGDIEKLPPAQPQNTRENTCEITRLSNDSISRQTAIDDIKAMYEWHDVVTEDRLIEHMKRLPSAQPEKCEDCENFNKTRLVIPQPERKTGKWIPVTERLPEIDMSHPHHEDYLVQYDSGGIDVASWSNVNRFWTDHVTEPYWNCVQFAKVIAWMPLPQPYKENEE